jgi:hypothetical protein
MRTSADGGAWKLLALFSLTWAKAFAILGVIVGVTLTNQPLLVLTFGVLAIVFEFAHQVARIRSD